MSRVLLQFVLKLWSDRLQLALIFCSILEYTYTVVAGKIGDSTFGERSSHVVRSQTGSGLEGNNHAQIVIIQWEAVHSHR